MQCAIMTRASEGSGQHRCLHRQDVHGDQLMLNIMSMIETRAIWLATLRNHHVSRQLMRTKVSMWSILHGTTLSTYETSCTTLQAISTSPLLLKNKITSPQLQRWASIWNRLIILVPMKVVMTWSFKKDHLVTPSSHMKHNEASCKACSASMNSRLALYRCIVS